MSKLSQLRRLRKVRHSVGKRRCMHLAVVTFNDDGVRFYYRSGAAFLFKTTGHKKVDFAATEKLKSGLVDNGYTLNTDDSVAIAPSVTLEYLYLLFPHAEIHLLPKEKQA